MYRFEKFEIWKDARKFVKRIYILSKKFPNEERFGLINQIRRAVVSIVLNIAEGSDRKSDIEFRRFLRMSTTSLNEVVTILYLCVDLHYIDQKEFSEVYSEANILSAKINSFIKKLK